VSLVSLGMRASKGSGSGSGWGETSAVPGVSARSFPHSPFGSVRFSTRSSSNPNPNPDPSPNPDPNPNPNPNPNLTLTLTLRQRPFFNEVVFCHKPSRTLIVSDLWCDAMSRRLPPYVLEAATLCATPARIQARFGRGASAARPERLIGRGWREPGAGPEPGARPEPGAGPEPGAACA
jgi:hypothetical protein